MTEKSQNKDQTKKPFRVRLFEALFFFTLGISYLLRVPIVGGLDKDQLFREEAALSPLPQKNPKPILDKKGRIVHKGVNSSIKRYKRVRTIILLFIAIGLGVWFGVSLAIEKMN